MYNVFLRQTVWGICPSGFFVISLSMFCLTEIWIVWWQITRNGMPTRLIPSLNGGLYQYDGESIEAVPMTADTLLSSSNKLNERMMMVGGKDQVSYGVNPATGQVGVMWCVAHLVSYMFFGVNPNTEYVHVFMEILLKWIIPMSKVICFVDRKRIFFTDYT